MTLLNQIEASISAKKSLLSEEKKINKAILKIYHSLKNKNKILICGNGGSAADAQHLSAEFLVRLRPGINRQPLPIISLALDTSTITACSNDYSFDQLFSRNFQAIYNKGDILICISTSGNSKNILNVLKLARKKKIYSITFLGNNGGAAKKFANLTIIVDSSHVSRIQETHIFLGHYILKNVEDLILKKN
jgi:D-sedoheptulose 7-phosphate isomerase